MKKAAQAKVVLVAILALLAVIVLLQNMATVETKLLFWAIPMPRALLLLITLGIGFVAGLLAATIWDARKR